MVTSLNKNHIFSFLFVLFLFSSEAIHINSVSDNLLKFSPEVVAGVDNLTTEQLQVILGEVVSKASSSLPNTGRDLLFLKDLLEDLKGLVAKGVAELGELFDDDDFDAKLRSMKDILKPEKPFEARNFTEGIMTGLLSVFIPKLEKSESGMESIVAIQQCFDPRQIHAEFFSQEAIKLRTDWDVQSLTDSEQKALKDLSDQITLKTSIGQIKDKIKNNNDALQAMRKFVKVLRRLAPLLLALIAHSIDCGPGEILIGFVMSFIISLFPPIMLIIVPVGVAVLGITLWNELKGIINEYGQNWFRFGKHVGKFSGLIAGLIVAYKKSKNRELLCTKEGECGLAEFKDGESSDELNKKKYWSGTKKHGNNQVYQRDSLIDPYKTDNKGRTNLIRMKQGLAPLGPDGQSLNLHHVSQSQNGPIAELTKTYHSKNHGALHKLCKVGCESQIDREAFAAWRTSYWRLRGADMNARLAAGGGKVAWSLAPVFGAMVGNPTTLKVAREQVSSFVGDLIDENNKDLPNTNILRILLSLLKPLVQKAVDKENKIIDNGMGTLEQCGFDPDCEKTITIDRVLSTSGEIASGKTKNFIVVSSTVQYIRIIAESSLRVLLKESKIDHQLNSDDNLALALKCSQKPLFLEIVAPNNNTASFSILFGDIVKCVNESVKVIDRPPDVIARSATDNIVGGVTRSSMTSDSNNVGIIVGAVIGGVFLIALITAIIVFILYKKGVIFNEETKKEGFYQERLLTTINE